MKNLSFGKKRRRRRSVDFEMLGPIVKWIFQIAIVCLIAFVFVCYFGHRIRMSGDSMSSVMKNGDVVLVNRIAYNVSRPKQGDVIAFKLNGIESSHSYIRRIVALPGETVELQDGADLITLGDDEYLVAGDNNGEHGDNGSKEYLSVKRSEIEGEVWFLVTLGSRFGFVK